MVKIYFRDNCAWFEEGHKADDSDRILLTAVTISLGDQLPKHVPVNHIAWYSLIGDGFEGVWPRFRSFAVYEMNREGL